MNEEIARVKLHCTYLIVIMFLALVFVSTERWSVQENFTEYLSNAATMTSLVLGVVAILYSFVANDGLSKSLGNISVVSDDVRKSKEEISKFLDQTKDMASSSLEGRQAMEKISVNLTGGLAVLQDTLSALSTKTSELHSVMGVLPTKLEKMEIAVAETAKAIGEKSTKVSSSMTGDPLWNEGSVRAFLDKSTLVSNLLVYACVLAKNKSAELSLKKFSEATETNFENYNSGFIAAMYAAQLIERSLIKDKQRTYLIEDVDPILENAVRPYFVGYVNSSNVEQGDVRAGWLKKLESVENMFL